MILQSSVSLEADGPRPTHRYTRGELLADGTIHLLGTSAALAACVALLALAVRSDNLLTGLAIGPYLTGLVAGSMTRKNCIGYVAAFPIPEVIRGINAFTLGARAVNPEVEVRVVWTKTWYDPLLEKEAARSLLDVGADVIAHHQDTVASQEAAEERGAFSVGYNSDAGAAVPKSCLTSAVFVWGGLYKNIVEQIRSGKWRHGSYWYGIESGALDIAPYGPMVPQSVRELTDKAKADIKSGALVVFSGPVKDQQGTVRIPAGTVPADSELLRMDWFVAGVIGTP